MPPETAPIYHHATPVPRPGLHVPPVRVGTPDGQPRGAPRSPHPTAPRREQAPHTAPSSASSGTARTAPPGAPSRLGQRTPADRAMTSRRTRVQSVIPYCNVQGPTPCGKTCLRHSNFFMVTVALSGRPSPPVPPPARERAVGGAREGERERGEGEGEKREGGGRQQETGGGVGDGCKGRWARAPSEESTHAAQKQVHASAHAHPPLGHTRQRPPRPPPPTTRSHPPQTLSLAPSPARSLSLPPPSHTRPPTHAREGGRRGGGGTPDVDLNYGRFKRNNFNICSKSWNYRGCWHQTCPLLAFSVVTVHRSFYEPDRIKHLVLLVTTSDVVDWVVCAPAAFLRSMKHVSCSFSGVEPKSSVTRHHHRSPLYYG